MSQERREALRRFEQKMREQGADGFADGPRPWEHWDESGHQANNRIWEGSARRIYPGSRKARSLGHRLLSVLAFIALTTLLVGIGGVYFSHTQTQQLAATAVQPLPFTEPPRPAAADSDSVIVAATTQKLNELSAPAAGTGPTQPQRQAAVEMAPADIDRSPDRDGTAAHTVMAMPPLTIAETAPPETTGAAAVGVAAADTDLSPDRGESAAHTVMAMPAPSTPEKTLPETTGAIDSVDSVDSVAIETIVTEQSVTTTVYTRNPRQDEAEVVAAIETTPPPFAHKIAAREAPDSRPSTPASTDDVESREAVADASAANLQLLPIDAPAAPEAPPEALPDNLPAATHTEANATIAAADMSSETTATESQAEVQADVIDAQHAALPDNPPAAQAEAATMVAAVADSGTATTVKDSPADDAAEIIPAAEFETVTPMATVVKTGNWVINLASYTRESMANRKLALFQQQGVDAEVFEVAINDKPMYRIRLAGFESRRAAQAEVKPVEQLLGLEGVWVSKR